MVTWDSVGLYLLTGAIGVISLVFLLGIGAAGYFFIRRQLRFKQYNVIIWERDGFGQLKQTYDQAGIFIDRKTKNKRLFLKRGNVGLNPDHIPYILSLKGNKTIYLYKTGLKNYHYVSLRINDPKITLTVGEEDVNWAVNDYEKQKKIFDFQNWLMQILPFIVLVFSAVIILVMFIYLFRQAPVLAQAAEAFARGASETKDLVYMLRNGTAVLPS